VIEYSVCHTPAGQRTEYVTQTITHNDKTKIYGRWDPNNSKFGYTKELAQEFTHIPWSIYDFNKFNIDMPICRCKGEFKCKQAI
jgi:hypothetical protein